MFDFFSFLDVLYSTSNCNEKIKNYESCMIVADLGGIAAWGCGCSFSFWDCWPYCALEFERGTFTTQDADSKGSYFRNIFGYDVKCVILELYCNIANSYLC